MTTALSTIYTMLNLKTQRNQHLICNAHNYEHYMITIVPVQACALHNTM